LWMIVEARTVERVPGRGFFIPKGVITLPEHRNGRSC
jgi:hypothetical protein